MNHYDTLEAKYNVKEHRVLQSGSNTAARIARYKNLIWDVTHVKLEHTRKLTALRAFGSGLQKLIRVDAKIDTSNFVSQSLNSPP